MRNLWLNSLLICLLSFGCSKKNIAIQANKSTNQSAVSCIVDLKPQFTSVLYNTKVDVIGKHLSGLLIFKTMPDSSIRVVFSSEMGVNFFDFEYSTTGFKVHSCMKQLNKKIVINQLKKDIGLLFMYGCKPEEAFQLDTPKNELSYGFVNGDELTNYIADSACTSIKRVENGADGKVKVLVNMFGSKGLMADSAVIVHQNFDFTISLKQIVR